MSGTEGLLISALLAGGSAYQSKRQDDRNASLQRQSFQQNQLEEQRQRESDLGRNQQLFQVAQQDAQRAQQRDELKDKAVEEATQQPLQELQNTDERLGLAEKQRSDVARSDLETSLQAGEQSIGGGVAGNVSEAFSDASQAQEATNIRKAGRNIDLNSIIRGLGDVQRGDALNVSDAGRNASILRGQAGTQKEIDAFLRQLGENRATLDNTLAPNPVVVI